MNTAQQLT